MDFLKYYLPLMLQLFGTQIIISLLSGMLYTTLFDYPVLLVIATVLALGIYFYLQYRTVWEHTCRESLRLPEKQHHIGHISGLIIGLCAGLPAFVFNLIPALFLRATDTFEFSGGFPYISYVIAKLLFNGQYLSIINAFFDPTLGDAATKIQTNIASLPYYLLTILPLAFVTWFAFWLGLKDKSLSSLLGIQVKTKKDKGEQKPILKK